MDNISNGSTVAEIAAETKAFFSGKFAEHSARLDDIEQKTARNGGFVGERHQPTLGEQFVDDDRVKAYLDSNPSKGAVDFRAKATITSATTNAAGSVGGLVVPQRDAYAGMPRRRLTIRDLLTVVRVTAAGSVEYPHQVSHATGADVVAEGAAKPQSDLQFELKSVPLRVIAHWVKASRQILDDAPQLSGIIDSELLYGLAMKEEAELLYGDGTGQHLNGMVTQATAFDNALRVVGDTKIDTIGRAILQASLTELPPDGIIMHPADWWAMRLTKDAASGYVLGDPMADLEPRLFGLPVVPTQAHAVGTFTVGAFGAQTLYDRWDARVEVGYINDDFTKNLMTVLGEERIGFAAKQPQAVITGPFVAP